MAARNHTHVCQSAHSFVDELFPFGLAALGAIALVAEVNNYFSDMLQIKYTLNTRV